MIIDYSHKHEKLLVWGTYLNDDGCSFTIQHEDGHYIDTDDIVGLAKLLAKYNDPSLTFLAPDFIYHIHKASAIARVHRSFKKNDKVLRDLRDLFHTARVIV